MKIENEIWLMALKWWNSISDLDRLDYEKRYREAMDKRIVRFEWNSEEYKIYQLYCNVRCFEINPELSIDLKRNKE